VAGAYAVRATPELSVSAPLAWNELTDALDPLDYTIETMPGRIRAVGDLWSPSPA
jgi:bifunctional non-homologous end joining protein LigD